MNVNPRSLLIARLGEEDLPQIPDFDCGDHEMNRFFREECYHEQSLGLNSTYVLYYNGVLAAFCSVCADKLTLEKDEKTEHDLPRGSVPAVKVARIGRSVAFKGMGFGEFLLDYVHLKAIELSETELGVRFLTLDAYPSRVAFYKSKGFQENLRQSKKTDTISMRLDIFREND